MKKVVLGSLFLLLFSLVNNAQLSAQKLPKVSADTLRYKSEESTPEVDISLQSRHNRSSHMLRGLPPLPATADYLLSVEYFFDNSSGSKSPQHYTILSQGKILIDGADGRLYVSSHRSNLPAEYSMSESALLQAVLTEVQKSPAIYGVFHKSARYNYFIANRDTIIPSLSKDTLRLSQYTPRNSSIMLCRGTIITDAQDKLVQSDLIRDHITGYQRVKSIYDKQERPIEFFIETDIGFYKTSYTAHLTLFYDHKEDRTLFEEADLALPLGEESKNLIAAENYGSNPFDFSRVGETSAYSTYLNQLDLQVNKDDAIDYNSAMTYGDKFKAIIQGGEGSNYLGRLLTGGTVRISPNDLFQFGGLKGVVQAYTPVDGLGLGQYVNYGHFFDRTTLGTLSSQVYYGLSSKRWNWSIGGMLDMNWADHGLLLQLSGGHHTADIERFYGEDPFWEALSFFILSMNTLRYYDKSYVGGKAVMKLSDELKIGVKGWSEKRRPLSTLKSTTMMGLPIEPNMPDEWYSQFPNHKAVIFHGSVEWTPHLPLTFLRQIREDKATILFEMEHGDVWEDENKVSEPFNFVSAYLYHALHLGLFSSIYYGIGAGAYFNTKSLQIPDRHPFNESTAIISSSNFDWTYSLMPPYYTWGKNMVDGHLSVHSNMLLTSYIPVLQRLGFSEAVHLHGTMFDNNFYHVEGGYSIGIREAIRLGAFVAWGDDGFRGLSVRLSFPILIDLKNQFFPTILPKSIF